MKIIILGHTRIGSDFVVGSHHLYRSFKKLGHDVIHFSLPISFFHLLKIKDLEVRTRFRVAMRQKLSSCEHENYIPLCILPITYIPKGTPDYLKRFLSTPQGLTKTVKSKFGNLDCDLLIVDHPSWAGTERLLNSNCTIYRPTDVYTNFNPANSNSEESLIKSADLIIATSAPVQEHVESYQLKKKIFTIRNGVDLEAWQTSTVEPVDIKNIPRPRAIYIGALDSRFDFQMVESTAKQAPSISFILIGPANKGSREPLPNVHYLGSRHHSLVPSYLEHCDVGIIPTSDHPANDGRSPMKIYEYAASGLGVVAKRTTELASRKEDGFLLLYIDQQGFLESLNLAIALKNRISSEAKAIAQKMSWRTIAEKILHITTSSKEL